MRIIVIYAIDAGGCSGTITSGYDTPGLVQEPFERETVLGVFQRVHQKLHAVIPDHVLVRVTGNPPYVLPQAIAHLLAFDVEAAVEWLRLMAPPYLLEMHAYHRHYSVCEETLADCVGVTVACAPREGAVVCPFCGGDGHISRSPFGDMLICQYGEAPVLFTYGAYVFVETAALLQTGRSKFFIPAAWNNYREFISSDELLAAVNRYNQELETYNAA